MTESNAATTDRDINLAFFDREDRAQRAVDSLIEQDFPLDRVSILGKPGGAGDDPLGVYYPSAGDRIKGWGKMGALWGGLFGLVGGAFGMFVVPGIGPMMIAGPLIDTLVGAGVGGALMAGGASLSELTVAIHRMGVPEERLQETQQFIESGHYVLLLIVRDDETEGWRQELERQTPEALWSYPYVGISDVLTGSG
jgi:hypothetical protein